MKEIGIKLADGSFYSVMEDGKPGKKNLVLTTVKDNQTRVIVDVYRSRSSSMEDAEYIDSLQIDGLIPHPNGEAELSLIISLDENNKLSASMVDPETGIASDANITLVSRTLEERLQPTNYEIVGGADIPEDESAILEDENSSFEVPEESSDVAPEIDSDFDMPDGLSDEEIGLPEEEISDFPSDTPSENSNDTPNPTGEGLLARAIAYNEKEKADEDSLVEEDLPAEEDTLPSLDDNLDLDLPSFTDDEPIGDENISESPSEVEQSEPTDDSSFGTPDFGFGNDGIADDSEIPEEGGEEPENLFETEKDVLDPLLGDTDSELDADDDMFDDNDLDLPEPEDGISETESMNTDDSVYVSQDPPPSNGINFSGLYDEETNDESTSYNEEEDEVAKKTKVPVIICVICAIICLIATGLILFIVPSKYNLLGKHQKTDSTPTAIEKTVDDDKPDDETTDADSSNDDVIDNETTNDDTTDDDVTDGDTTGEDISDDDATDGDTTDNDSTDENTTDTGAKEDEIVVVTETEIVDTVVPEPPQEPEKKPENIVYKIKWGDTLWDIADAYYKNPWKYHFIARYNGIKDPDYIISGRTLILPAQ